MKTPIAIAAVLATASTLLGAEAAAQGAPTPERVLERMDRNGDGSISRGEWRGPPGRFGRIDADGDKVVTRGELEAAIGKRAARADAQPPAIDAHAHLHAMPSKSRREKLAFDHDAAADSAIREMDAHNIGTTILMMPPSIRAGMFSYRSLIRQQNRYPGRFAVLGGGGILNPIIQTTDLAQVSAKVRRQFEAEAGKILKGGAIGFGEISGLHFSFNANHPFENAPVDHPLMLQLADIAARHGVPIDLHHELVPENMTVPPELTSMSSLNPNRVSENVTAFERLLAHNRGATIVLAHSMDSTGGRTAAVIRRLMEENPNLMMTLNVRPGFPLERNMALNDDGLDPEWRKLVMDHPDRFMLGSDHFHTPACSNCERMQRLTPSLRWLGQFPPGIAKKIGSENARRIYKLMPRE